MGERWVSATIDSGKIDVNMETITGMYRAKFPDGVERTLLFTGSMCEVPPIIRDGQTIQPTLLDRCFHWACLEEPAHFLPPRDVMEVEPDPPRTFLDGTPMRSN